VKIGHRIKVLSLFLMSTAGLSILLYVPCWILVGAVFYPHTHPDYWGPNSVVLTVALTISVSAMLAILLMKALKNESVQ